MLNNLGNQAESGCLLGIAIWGNPDLNKFFGEMEKSVKELGFKSPNRRT